MATANNTVVPPNTSETTPYPSISATRGNLEGRLCMHWYVGESLRGSYCQIQNGKTKNPKVAFDGLHDTKAVVTFTPNFGSDDKVYSYVVLILPPKGEHPPKDVLRRIDVTFDFLGRETLLQGQTYMPSIQARVYQRDVVQLKEHIPGHLLEPEWVPSDYFCDHGMPKDRVEYIHLGAFRPVNVGLSRERTGPVAEEEPIHIFLPADPNARREQQDPTGRYQFS